MKQKFSCTLEGKTWWKPFLAYLAIIVYIQIQISIISKVYKNLSDTAGITLSLGSSIITTVVSAIFTIVLLHIALPTISIKEKHFAFFGNIGDF